MDQNYGFHFKIWCFPIRFLQGVDQSIAELYLYEILLPINEHCLRDGYVLRNSYQ